MSNLDFNFSTYSITEKLSCGGWVISKSVLYSLVHLFNWCHCNVFFKLTVGFFPTQRFLNDYGMIWVGSGEEHDTASQQEAEEAEQTQSSERGVWQPGKGTRELSAEPYVADRNIINRAAKIPSDSIWQAIIFFLHDTFLSEHAVTVHPP